MNDFVKIGLKIAGAILAGGAVFVGLDKAFNNKNTNEALSQQSINNNSHKSNENSYNGDQPQQTAVEQNTGDKVISYLKKTQETCNRALNVIQNITIAADSIVRIFNGNNQLLPNQNYGGYYNNGYGGYYNNDIPAGYRRISPFILEYVGEGNNHNNNYNNGGGCYRGY